MEKLKLEEQIKLLSISSETIYAQKTEEKGKWKPLQSNARGISVEELVLNHFKAQGWDGLNDEGQNIIAIIMALSYEHEALTGQPFAGHFESKHDFFRNPLEHRNNVRNYVQQIPKEQFEKLLNRRLSFVKKVVRNSQSVKKTTCIELWQILGNNFFSTWIDLHIKSLMSSLNPLGSAGIATGIPDLLIWKKHTGGRNEIRFVEIKAKGDRLKSSQIHWIKNAVPQLKLNFSIVRVLPQEDMK